MIRTVKWLAALLLTVSTAGLIQAAEEPTPPVDQGRLDAHGDLLPEGSLARFGTLRWRHGAAVVFAAYTTDGTGLLTASQDGTLRLWDAETGKEIRRFGNPPPQPNPAFPVERQLVAFQPNMIACAASSPDGHSVVIGGQDGSVTFYDIATGKQVRQLKINPANGIAAIAFSADGKTVLAKSFNQVIQMWDTAEGKELRKFAEQQNPQRVFYNGGPSSAMALIDEGKTLASGAMEFDNNQVVAVVKLYDVGTGKETATIKGPVNGVQSLAFAPDGKTFAWGTNTSTVSVWDVATKKEIHSLTTNRPNGFYANALIYSPDGKSIVGRSYDQSLIVWELATGKERMQLGAIQNNYGGFPCNLAYSRDGRRIASGYGFNSVRQWDVGTGDAVGFHAGHDAPVLTVACPADGKTIITRGGDNVARVWDAMTGKEVRSFALPVVTTQVAISADGKTLASAGYDGILRLWDPETGKQTIEWQANNQPNRNFMALALSPDGKTIAARGYEPAVHIWEASTGKELRQLVEPPVFVNGQATFGFYYGGGQIVFSRDGGTLAVLSGNGGGYALRGEGKAVRQVNNTVRLWDVATGRQLRQLDMTNIAVAALTFAPDGRSIATSNHNGTLSLWEAASGKERFQFKPTTPGVPTLLTYSPDGKFLAGGVSMGQESAVRFWDAANGKELSSHRGHQSAITTLAFAVDGKRIVTGSQDTTALLWDTGSLKSATAPMQLTAEQTEALWNDLAGTDAKKAYDAFRSLSASADTTALMRSRLRPVPAPDTERLAQLIADLDSNVFVVRQKATAELEKLGELAEPELQRVLADKPALEIRQRVERLLEKLATGDAPPAEELRALRAIEVLEHISTPEAREAIEVLVKGAPGARVTRQAQVALERLGKR